MSIAAFVVIATLVLLASLGVVLAGSTKRQLTSLSICGALVAVLAAVDGSIRLTVVIALVALGTAALIWSNDARAWKFGELDFIEFRRSQLMPLLVVAATTVFLLALLFTPFTFFTHPPVSPVPNVGFLHQGFLLWVVLLLLLAVVSGLGVYKLAAVDRAEEAHAKATEVRRRHRDQMLKRRQARLANRGDAPQAEVQA